MPPYWRIGGQNKHARMISSRSGSKVTLLLSFFKKGCITIKAKVIADKYPEKQLFFYTVNENKYKTISLTSFV